MKMYANLLVYVTSNCATTASSDAINVHSLVIFVLEYQMSFRS